MHHVPGLVEAHVNNMTEVWEALQTGSNARAVGSTNANGSPCTADRHAKLGGKLRGEGGRTLSTS